MEKISVVIEKKGQRLYESGKVKKELDTKKRTYFNVKGETEEHSVIFDKEKKKWECDCRYWALRQKVCSHILACKASEKI